MRPRRHLLWLLPIAIGAPSLSAQQPAAPAFAERTALATAPADSLALRLGLRRLPLPWPIELGDAAERATFALWSFEHWIGVPPASRPPSQTLAESTPPGAAWFRIWGGRGGDLAADTALTADSLVIAAGESGRIGGLVTEYADIGMVVEGRSELGGAWTRFQPCDPAYQFRCDPGLFPQLRPDMQFGVRVGGTISERIHVDVDYDQRREFDAANNINVFYQGLEGELLQRVEVGDVAIRLPASRYLTEGVPGGNFGFRALLESDAFSLETVFAQQNGDITSREFRLGGVGGPGDFGAPGAGPGLVQSAQLALDDGDYVRGQFFFVLDPRALSDYPQVDVLALQLAAAPAALRPADEGSIILYRDERPSLTNPEQQAQLGYFLAQARSADGTQRHSGLFRRMVPGDDYGVHSSGLWLTLRSPLRADEALAVAYVTASGDTVGTPDAERRATGTSPLLRLLRGPATQHQPGQPTWELELHNVYRVDASPQIDANEVKLAISLGELAAGRSFAAFEGRQIPLVRLFGMDEESPRETLDATRVYQPGAGGAPGSTASGPRGTFVVFPTLRPFAEPPGTSELTVDQAAVALGGDANVAIYDEPDPARREAGTRFRLTLEYPVQVDGGITSFSLGAFGIREGSERITVDGVPLRRGVDYTIDYDLGMVTLLAADAALGGNPNAEIRATWEQKAAFDVAPTTLVGVNAAYDLGERGALGFVGLYRAEKTLQTRPQLGLEPGRVLLGGVSGTVDLGGGWLDNALGALPVRREPDATSSLRLTGELALSLPDPNTGGATFLDDFEASDAVPLSLDRRNWRLGSRPELTTGAEGTLPEPLDVATAAPLVWQHDYSIDGNVVGAQRPSVIDRQIRVAGAEIPEPVMYVTFGAGAGAGAEAPHGWRAFTTVLATTGRDLSQTEFLEFYAAAPEGRELALVLDLGTVSEDAFHFDETGATNGVYPDGEPWGLGLLDEEASLAAGEVWGESHDQRGLWNRDCRAEPGQTYPLGDPRANCAQSNGLVDTEDLDGNGFLDAADGAHFRYVVPLDRVSRYLVRGRDQTGTQFQLYRIPLRDAAAAGLNGAGPATLRSVKHLRVTVAGDVAARSTIELARLRLVGSRYTKRAGDGVLAGLIEDRPGSGAGLTRVHIGPVSRLTDGAAYSSPPGVQDQLQDPTIAFGATGVEFNEKSLRIGFETLEAGDRAEAYFRYPQQPRDFLAYRELRLWSVQPRGGATADELRLVLKVGTDERNYYLWQGPLQRAPGANVVPEDWLPERSIDFERWFALRAEAERVLAERGFATGLEALTVWSEDSTYAVVLDDRSRAPNLAAVREISFAVYNAGALAASGEVWIDELRLGGGVTDPSGAGHLNLAFDDGGFISGSASLAGRGALYRQLGQSAPYQSAGDLELSATAQLGRVLPEHWGLDAPITVQLGRAGLDPLFVERSDLRADRLGDLRPSGAGHTRVGMTLRRATPLDNRLLGLFLDGAALRLNWASATTDRLISAERTRAFDAGLSYGYRPQSRTLDITPGFIEDLLDGITPAGLQGSELFQRLRAAELRWSAEDIAFSTTYRGGQSSAFRYAGILEGQGQDLPPVRAPRERLDNQLRLALRPFASLGGGIDVRAGRDLLPTAQASGGRLQQDAIARERARVGGLDLGWERDRAIDSRLDFRPTIADWIRPSLSWRGRYRTAQTPSLLEIEVLGTDTSALMMRGWQGERQLTRGIEIVPDAVWGGGGRGGETDPDSVPAAGLLARVTRAIQPIQLSWQSSVSSRFERETEAPGLGYQLGWGDFEAFRRIRGDTAVAALLRERFRAATGVRMPLGLLLEAAYTKGDARAANLRGGSLDQDERIWPDLLLAWTQLPVPGWLAGVVRNASVSAGYQRTERADLLHGGQGERRGRDEHSVPLQLSIGLGSSLVASYTGALRRGEGFDATGMTESDATGHALQLTGSLAAPTALRGRVDAPFRLSLNYRYEADRECRLRVLAGDACAPFIDQLHRALQMTLETTLSDLDVGIQMSYNDRQSYIGTRGGTTQFQLGIFGQFRFEAGQLR
ncbi:MAG: cell surface protein SprA [Longimicrobiales bacterium]